MTFHLDADTITRHSVYIGSEEWVFLVGTSAYDVIVYVGLIFLGALFKSISIMYRIFVLRVIRTVFFINIVFNISSAMLIYIYLYYRNVTHVVFVRALIYYMFKLLLKEL